MEDPNNGEWVSELSSEVFDVGGFALVSLAAADWEHPCSFPDRRRPGRHRDGRRLVDRRRDYFAGNTARVRWSEWHHEATLPALRLSGLSAHPGDCRHRRPRPYDVAGQVQQLVTRAAIAAQQNGAHVVACIRQLEAVTRAPTVGQEGVTET